VAVGRQRLSEAVVDIGAQGMQRDFALAILLAAGHLRSGQTAGTHHADAAHAQFHGAQHGLAHGALIGDTLLDLLRNGFGHQLRVDVGVADLLNADMDLLFGQFLQFGPQVVHALAAAPDDDAGLGRMQRDFDAVAGALDLDAGDGSRR
jgi:hypothetical protein